MDKQQIVFKKCEHVTKDMPEWALCEDCYYKNQEPIMLSNKTELVGEITLLLNGKD